MSLRHRFSFVLSRAVAPCMLLLLPLAACGGNQSTHASGSTTMPPPPMSSAWTAPQPQNIVSQAQPATALPKLPVLTNVAGKVNGDSVTLTFDPVDGAADYRIYALPPDSALKTNADGSITVANGVYRCAGTREALFMLPDTMTSPYPGADGSSQAGLTVVNGTVAGVARTMADATLGYVYATPGTGRLPVYVVANSDAMAGDQVTCSRPIFNVTRQKTYTTDVTVATSLIAAGGRDDGIAFYVPMTAGAATRPLYEGVVGGAGVPMMTLRWIDGAEGTARGSAGKPIFNVLTAAAADAVPLMRVNVQPFCGGAHDELTAGAARFKEAFDEGDQPLASLRWSGMTGPTTLVLEALDQGCPYQGFFSPMHEDAGTLFNVAYPTYMTLDDLRAASSTTEVFINGQYGATNVPKAVARSFIQLSPAAPPTLDFFDGFDQPETFTVTMPDDNAGTQRFQSTNWNLWATSMNALGYGQVFGEMWFSYADIGADVGGKFRLTSRTKATVSDKTFLHVTGEVDMVVTDRRYPQFIISNQDVPVQPNFPNAGAKTLIVQPKGWSLAANRDIQIEECDARLWEVNNQCPILASVPAVTPPAGPLSTELFGVDRTVKYDIYVSTSRIYVLLNDYPYACTSLPATANDSKTYSVPSGAVTVSWGDVLYHSGVDIDGPSAGGLTGTNSFQFHLNHMKTVTRRHFDNLGFASGVAAPTWNETRFPCVSHE